MNIKIVCFAGLRKYFGNETSVFVESGNTYSKVIDELMLLKPEAKEILASSRIAVNEKFVSLNETISENTLFLIPPSSGG
jgi:molybdopterin converting factor small subunit